MKKLCDIPVGDTFMLGDMEFIVLEQAIDGTHVILKNFWKTARFDGKTNNYTNSALRRELNTEFFNKVAALCGGGNIVGHAVDLTSDDGRKDYKNVFDYVSLLTCDQYRKYVYILDRYRPNNWWWLATAFSTEANGYDTFVRIVNDVGTLINVNCISSLGVRPFLILESFIFVS